MWTNWSPLCMSIIRVCRSSGYVDHQGIGGSEMFGPEGFSDVVMLFRQAHPRLRVEIEKMKANSDTVQAQLFWSDSGPTTSAVSETSYQKRTEVTVRFDAGWPSSIGTGACTDDPANVSA